jgi:hypothetical protein
MLRDGYSNFKFFQALEPQGVDATDLTGVDINTQGFESLTIVVNVGYLSNITSSSYAQLILQHASNSTTGAAYAATYANVSATDLIGLTSAETSLTSGVWRTIGADATGTVTDLGSQTFQIGYRGTKQFVRLYVDCVGAINSDAAHKSACIGAIAILGYPANWPVNSEETLDYVG